MLNESWKNKAICGGLTELFYSEERVDQQAARSVCVECPVRLDCLDYAVRHREKFGIWGGLGEERRRPLMRLHRAGEVTLYKRALNESTQYLGRAVAGFDDERPRSPEHPCDRCGSLVVEGRHPPDRNGPGAQCGKTSTYNKGCRCMRCLVAKGEHGEAARNRR
jgi:WhiB family redox-sensing transcriptional regulator